MRIRVLSLNVWAMPWLIVRDLDWRMQELGEALPSLGIDVAAFQEVWNPSARVSLIEAGRRSGLTHQRHPPGGDGGLLILSRFPISDARFEQYHLRGLPEKIHHADYYGRKGFLTVSLETGAAAGDGAAADDGGAAGDGAGVVELIDTHLHASYRERAEDEYVGHRVGQTVQLAMALRRMERPLIALGDTNFEETFEEHDILLGLSGLHDVAAELDRREDTVLDGNRYRAADEPSGRIDYVFRRDGVDRSVTPISVERVLDGELVKDGRAFHYSDHAGLVAELEIAPGGEPLPSPRPSAVESARRLLLEGRELAESRQSKRRSAGLLGMGVALGGALTARSDVTSRRRLLHDALIGSAGLAGLLGIGCLALAQIFSPSELHAFDEMLSRLDQMDPGAS